MRLGLLAQLIILLAALAFHAAAAPRPQISDGTLALSIPATLVPTITESHPQIPAATPTRPTATSRAAETTLSPTSASPTSAARSASASDSVTLSEPLSEASSEDTTSTSASASNESSTPSPTPPPSFNPTSWRTSTTSSLSPSYGFHCPPNATLSSSSPLTLSLAGSVKYVDSPSSRLCSGPRRVVAPSSALVGGRVEWAGIALWLNGQVANATVYGELREKVDVQVGRAFWAGGRESGVIRVPEGSGLKEQHVGWNGC